MEVDTADAGGLIARTSLLFAEPAKTDGNTGDRIAQHQYTVGIAP